MEALEWILLIFLAIFAIGSIAGYVLFVKNEKKK